MMEHPAWGCISISSPRGGAHHFFGSDLQHDSFVEMEAYFTRRSAELKVLALEGE